MADSDNTMMYAGISAGVFFLVMIIIIVYVMSGDSKPVTAEKVTTTTTPASGALKGEYGAQFWLNAGQPGNPSNRTYPSVPTDCFFAEGYQGQQVFIIPGYDAVIVRLSLQKTKSFDENKFLAGVLRSIKK